MNKKIKLSLFVFIIIGVVILNFTYKNKNEETKTKKRKQNNFAIMIKEDGAADYTKSNSKDIPKGDYVLNRDKSYCKNNGVIGDYDSVLGKVSFSFIGTDSCYLYFDKIIDTQKPVISNLKINGKTITATLTDNQSLLAYGFSTSNTLEPTSWTSINGKTYNLSTTISTEGTYYLWVKDTFANVAKKDFTISLGTPITTLISTKTPDVYEENGLRYEGADPKNYICLDNKTGGACSDSSLLFRIIGLFDEDTSNDGTTSAGTKKLLKILDTNNYGGASGKYWNQTKTSGKNYNDWSTATLKTELNDLYLRTLLDTSGVNSKLENSIVKAKWHLGGAATSNYNTLTADGFYNIERTDGEVYGTNPSSIYAKVGLMYPSDYGYATVGGCREKAVYYYDTADCKNNDWLFTSQATSWGSNKNEWLLSPCSSVYNVAAYLSSAGYVNLGSNYSVGSRQLAVRPTFYLDSSILKIVGTGDGSSSNPYRIG